MSFVCTVTKKLVRIMSSKYTENVICLYCNKEVIRMSFVCTVTSRIMSSIY